jgi:orotidine-5'-phosphate decarboxylase
MSAPRAILVFTLAGLAGYDFTVAELEAEGAGQARDIGVDGLAWAAEEVEACARSLGPAWRSSPRASVRPARRPIAAGADYLAVGRPIIAAPYPRAAVAIVAEIAAERAA